VPPALRQFWRLVAQGGLVLRLGLVLLLLATFGVALGPSLTGWDGSEMDVMALLTGPSATHPFGTDSFGRDVLTRVMLGFRVSLLVSLVGVGLAAGFGTALGMAAAMVGGLFDAAASRLMDLLLALPSFVLALFLMLVFGFGPTGVVAALALIFLPNFFRLARGTTMAVKVETYVQAAIAVGQAPAQIMLREILPNIAGPLWVQFSTTLAFGLLVEAGLSFLGLGVQPTTPSLGGLMSEGKDYFESGPWVLTCTGLSISVVILSLNLVADGLRDLLDPRLRRTDG